MTASQARLGRRHVLVAMAALGLSGLIRLRWPAGLPTETVATRLARLFTQRESAVAVGREYLRRGPATASPDALAALVLAGLPGSPRDVHGMSDQQLRSQLALGITEDFGAQRTVELDGWIVSATEARLCALSAMCDPPTVARAVSYDEPRRGPR